MSRAVFIFVLFLFGNCFVIVLFNDAAELFAACGAKEIFRVKLTVKAYGLTARGAYDLTVIVILAVAAVAGQAVAVAPIFFVILFPILIFAFLVKIILNVLQIVVELLYVFIEVVQILVDLVVGLPVTALIDRVAPPLVSPSSLVSTNPVTSRRLLKVSATSTAT